MRYRKTYLKTGKLICEFIDAYELAKDVVPVWFEITDYLTQIGHATKQGGPWRQSSAQYALVRYCAYEDVDYPLPQRRGSLIAKCVGQINPETNEVTITLKITLPAGQKVNVVVD
jgi:hypothetical protein